MPAVGGGGAAGVAVQAVLVLQRRLDHAALPEGPAVGPAQAEQHPLVLLLQGGGEEDAVAPDDRRGVALAGDRDLQATLSVALQRVGTLVSSDCAVAVRPAPHGPVAPWRRRAASRAPPSGGAGGQAGLRGRGAWQKPAAETGQVGGRVAVGRS